MDIGLHRLGKLAVFFGDWVSEIVGWDCCWFWPDNVVGCARLMLSAFSLDLAEVIAGFG
jgi:hypothetical protein